MQYNGKQKNLIFGPFVGQKWALAAPLELVQQHEQHENVVFLVSGHDGTKKLKDVDKKLISGQKTDFWAQKGALWAIGAEKRPAERPNGHLPENQSYPESVSYTHLTLPTKRIV